MSQFELSEKNRVKRVHKRGSYDKKTVYDIVDSALIGHVGFVVNGEPFVIPTLIARQGDRLLLHGASSSRMMRHVVAGGEVSIAVTHVDGIVMARSVFHHSINYRSAVLFGTGRVVDGASKMEALRQFTEKLIPGRWDDCRLPNDVEMKATAVAEIAIDLASAKVRTGPPGDEEEDYALPYWAGVVPVRQVFGDPIADDRLPSDIATPDYVLDLINGSAK
jgi:hypothetical protein